MYFIYLKFLDLLQWIYLFIMKYIKHLLKILTLLRAGKLKVACVYFRQKIDFWVTFVLSVLTKLYIFYRQFLCNFLMWLLKQKNCLLFSNRFLATNVFAKSFQRFMLSMCVIASRAR